MMRAVPRSALLSLLAFGLVVIQAGCSELPTGVESADDPDQLSESQGSGTASGVAGAGYEGADLGTLGGGSSEATSVNDAGWVVGVSETVDGQQHAFLWTEESGMQDINGTEWSFSRAEDVNNSGVVVGWGIHEGKMRGFQWTAADGMSSIGVPGSHTSSYCFAINDVGEVVGMALSSSGQWNAIVWKSPTSYVILGSLGGTASRGLDINDAGRVAGKSTLSNSSSRAVLWVPQAPVRDLGTLGGSASEALGINETSQVVGWSYDGEGRVRPFLWSSEMRDLGTLGGDNGEAYGIGDDGSSVGYSETSAGQRHATLWTSEGGIVDLGVLEGADESRARAINGDGMIVGYSITGSGDNLATVWRAETEVTLPSLLERLKAEIRGLVDAGVLTERQGRRLLARVAAIERRLERYGDRQPPQRVVRAAIRATERLVGHLENFVRHGYLTEEQAQPLLEIALATIDLLEAML